MSLLDGGRAADRAGARASDRDGEAGQDPRTKKAATSESSEPPTLPDGTIGTHANGKLACEVCGEEFDDEGQVTSHYMEAHAS